MAVPDGMFSAIGTQASTSIASLSSAMAAMVAMTAAAPPMSDFMSSMWAAGLIEMPPESKVMPFPTSATFVFAPLPLWDRCTRRGGFAEPCPTPRIPPKAPFLRAFSSSTSTVRPTRPAASVAAAASSTGCRSDGGVLTRSRASLTAAVTI